MAYDESFAPELTTAEALPAETVTTAPETGAETVAAEAAANAEEAAAVDTTAAESTQAAADETAAEGSATGEGAASEAAPVAPAFDEAAYLKATFGEDAPATAAEMKQRLADMQARQVTTEQQAQLAMLSDPAKLAEFAQLATKDYDKPEAIDIMRERFAQRFPKLSEKAREHRFQSEFAQKYPTLADAIANPENYEGSEDPTLLVERELADNDALEDREALKTAQQDKIKQFVASQTAAPGPQLTTEQQADIAALPAWLDEAYKEGATIPVDAGDGLKFNLPIPNAADFKAAFNDTYGLLDKLTLTKPLAEGGVLNRANHALVTAFLQNPTAFVQNIAKQVRAAMPEQEAAIPVNQLNNSSANKRPPAKPAAVAQAPVEVGESNHKPHVNADAWLHSNA
jgi:hypothetical protein